MVGHPGYAATNLQASSTGVGQIVTYLGQKIIAQTAEDGTLGILICALQPGVENGAYYGPERLSGPAVALIPKSLSTDEADHDMLWQASSEAVGDFTVLPVPTLPIEERTTTLGGFGSAIFERPGGRVKRKDPQMLDVQGDTRFAPRDSNALPFEFVFKGN